MPGKKRTSIDTFLGKCLTEEQDRLFGQVATHICIPNPSLVHSKAVVNGSLNFTVANHSVTWLIYLAWTAAKLSKTIDTSCNPYRIKLFQAHKAWGINCYRLLDLVDGALSASPTYRNKWKGYHPLEMWSKIAIESKQAHLNALLIPSNGKPRSTQKKILKSALRALRKQEIPEEEHVPLLRDLYKTSTRIVERGGRKGEAFENQYWLPYLDSLEDVSNKPRLTKIEDLCFDGKKLYTSKNGYKKEFQVPGGQRLTDILFEYEFESIDGVSITHKVMQSNPDALSDIGVRQKATFFDST